MARTGQSEAVVLTTHAYRERDLIVAFFTRTAGKLRGVAHGARGGKVKRFGGALQPGTVVSLNWFERGRSDLVRVDECAVIRSFFSHLSGDLRLSFHHSYYLELTDGFTVQRDPSDDLFRLLRLALESSVGAGDRILTVRRYFEFWLLRLCGLFPDLFHCHGCGAEVGGDIRPAMWIHPDEGVLCPRCGKSAAPRWKLSPPAADRLARFSKEPLDAILQKTADPALAVDAGLEQLMVGCLRHNLGREIRSLSCLSRI